MKSTPQRGRTLSKGSPSSINNSSIFGGQAAQMTPQASSMADSNFGVQSLEDAMSSRFDSSEERSLSRTDSNLSNPQQAEVGAEGYTPNNRKRKAGNRVHPKIQAAGNRIISSELPSTQASSAASPVSYRSSESPFRPQMRRGSAASSVNMSQPLTPLRLSPHPEPDGLPGTPRSGSPKSFRLSDEEASVAHEMGNQAAGSSSDEDEYETRATRSECSMPQLVMPSITMPARRPFTERGKSMGRLKVMVVGPAGVGKTSLINSILRTYQDVVHVDNTPESSLGKSIRSSENRIEATKRVTEVTASTKPYPVYWSELKKSQGWTRRKSVVEGALERNLCFIDTPGLDSDESVQPVLSYMQAMLRRSADWESMSESELLSLFSGDGGIQVDAVLYVFGPSQEDMLEPAKENLLRQLSRWTNLVPVISQADRISSEEQVLHRKRNVVDLLESAGIPIFERRFQHKTSDSDGEHSWRVPVGTEPLAVSSALSNDADTMDASTLMSSHYVQPFVPSELQTFTSWLFGPATIARLRHLSAKKLLSWRRGNPQLLQKPTSTTARLDFPNLSPHSPVMPSASSHDLVDRSKVLVPHSDSSFYRSISTDTNAHSPSYDQTTTSALARIHSRNPDLEPPNLHVAKWAQDIQRSVYNDQKQYRGYYNQPHPQQPDTNEKAEGALVPRPPPGRLGGEISVFDPRDPLNLFSRSLRRRGFLILQVCGGAGILGAMVYWATRNWVEVQETLGFGSSGVVRDVPAVAAPVRQGFGVGGEGESWVEWVGEGWKLLGGLVGEALEV